jgi:hypothetical protein
MSNVEDVPIAVERAGDGSDDDWEDEERVGLLSFPPGEEGFLQSHAGGEVCPPRYPRWHD